MYRKTFEDLEILPDLEIPLTKPLVSYIYIYIYREEEEVSYRKIFEDLEIQVPAEYICSITMEIMSDPVLQRLILVHMCPVYMCSLFMCPATELQQSCYRAATNLQQLCNLILRSMMCTSELCNLIHVSSVTSYYYRAATELQQLCNLIHVY